MEGLKNGDVIAHLAQVAGAGQAGGAGADNGDLVAVGFRYGDSGLILLGHVVIGHKALQPADAHALTLDAPDALAFALLLLGADTAADGGQGVGGGDDLIGGVKVPGSHLGDELGDADGDGAAAAAGHIPAVEAALGLVHGHLGGVAQGYLIKVAGADDGVLLGHGVLGETHISHCAYLLSCCRCAGRPGPAHPYRRRHA